MLTMPDILDSFKQTAHRSIDESEGQNLMHEFKEKERYIEKYRGEIVVVKCGGETLDNEAALDNVFEQLLYLSAKDIHVILVHGGGSQIKARAEQLGIPEVKQNGVRVTCERTVNVVRDVLDKLNADLVHKIEAKAIENDMSLMVTGGGVTDIIVADQVDQMGYVGEPRDVRTDSIAPQLKAGHMHILHSLSCAEDGQILNVNADSVAGALAKSLQARRIIFCTSVAGVLDKQGQTIATLSPQSINSLIHDETISGGMVKKVRECEALLEHVSGVAIVASADKNSILKELLGEGGGTLIQRDTIKPSLGAKP